MEHPKNAKRIFRAIKRRKKTKKEKKEERKKEIEGFLWERHDAVMNWTEEVVKEYVKGEIEEVMEEYSKKINNLASFVSKIFKILEENLTVIPSSLQREAKEVLALI